jgi:osmotically-inducible protein OsmY/CBS domain-containing protein
MSAKSSVILKESEMDDKTLRQSVIDELEFDPRIDAADIGVAVDNGVVTLTGHVATFAERVAAEEIVNRVKGVRAIAQEIEVRRTRTEATPDDELAMRAVNLLGWDAAVPKNRIQVKVEKGWVTLSGSVDWQYQKVAAEEAIRRLDGVVGITSLIGIKAPTIQSANVKTKIEEALKRNAEIEASNIRVSVANGKVKLEGQVRAWYERRLVEQAAWAVRGVQNVEVNLHVDHRMPPVGHFKVKDVMHKGTVSVELDTKISEVAKRLRDSDIGAVPVKANGEIVGIVTDRDLVCRALADRRDIDQTTAGQVMSKDVVVCSADEDIDTAIHTMERRQVRRLPVIDSRKSLAGMLSLGDVSHTASESESGRLLRAVSAHHGK